MDKTNIVLIGMPSSGKSTIGRLLADELAAGFVDTDAFVEQYKGKSPKEIVEQEGLEEFLEAQERVISGLNLSNHVIATGGSVIYSQAAMEHLKAVGIVVYLKLELEELIKRMASGRRFARREGQTLQELYDQRSPLYEMYSDIILDCKNKLPPELIQDIKEALSKSARS